MPTETVTRTLFCLRCGATGVAEVPAPSEWRRDCGTTVDGTPMPGWCQDQECQAQQARFEAGCQKLLEQLHA